jgi:hypothetical protein
MGSVLEVEDVLGVGALVMTMLGLLGVAVWFCCSIVGNIMGTRRRLKDSRYEALLGENERLKGFLADLAEENSRLRGVYLRDVRRESKSTRAAA